MKIIGLTGGIACGKSTVSKALRALGAYIVDADAAAHALSQPKQPLFNAYVERFGADIVSPGGTLDRAAIAWLIFADPALRAEVDAIAHPLIRAEAERRLGAQEQRPQCSMCRSSLRRGGMRSPMRRGSSCSRRRSSLRVCVRGIL